MKNSQKAKRTESLPSTPDFLRPYEETAAAADDLPQQYETALFDDLSSALEYVAPTGSTVHAVGFDNVDMFLRAGYRVVDGEADVVIARGGSREFALAQKLPCRKLVLAPTHSYAAVASDVYRMTDGAFCVTRHGKKPHAAVFDHTDTDRNLASVFAELLALDFCAFDLAFGALMRGEQPDTTLTDDVATLVTETTNALRSNEKNREQASKILVNAGKRAAKITCVAPMLPYASGATQTAEALRMLYSAEERQLGMRGETEFLLATVIADFYIKNLDGQDSDFPPDNNKRIDRICEFFAADLRRTCIHLSAIYPPFKMRLCEYRRTEFRSEQAAMLAAVKRRQNSAMPVFKRLYPDDGYCLKTLVDKTDLPICIALAPDVFAADSMLSFFKQAGRLEKYLV